jgi:hypothetical protein
MHFLKQLLLSADDGSHSAQALSYLKSCADRIGCAAETNPKTAHAGESSSSASFVQLCMSDSAGSDQPVHNQTC